MANNLSDRVKRYLELHSEGKTIREIATLCRTSYKVVYSAIAYHVNSEYKDKWKRYQKNYQQSMSGRTHGDKPKPAAINKPAPYMDKMAADLGIDRLALLVKIMDGAVIQITTHNSDFTSTPGICIDHKRVMQNIYALQALRDSVKGK